MRILNRYLLAECCAAVGLTLIVAVGLFLTARILRLTSFVINKGVALSDVGMMIASLLPTFLELAIPLAVLIGIILAFARMAGDSELVVLRSSGVSIAGLLLPVVLVGGGAALATTVVSHVAKPWGHTTLIATMTQIARERSTATLSSGTFAELGPLTLYAEEVDPQMGTLKNIILDDRRNPTQRSITFAESGSLLSDTSGTAVVISLSNGELHERVNESYFPTRFSANQIVLRADELVPAETERGRRPRELTSSELRAEIANLTATITPETAPPRDTTRRLQRLKNELALRWSLPVGVLVLALLALPLGIQPARSQRSWGISVSLLVGFAGFLLYYATLSLSLALAEANHLPSVLAAWIPNFTVGALALYFLRQIGSERWPSVLEGVIGLVRRER